MTRRVVVTGYGLINALGDNAEQVWSNIKEGKSGIGPITRFKTDNYAVKIAAENKTFDAEKVLDKKEIRRTDPFQHFLLAASDEAVALSGFAVPEGKRYRSSVVIGSAIGGMKTSFENFELINETHDPRRITPFGITMVIVDGGTNILSVKLGAGGPSCTPVSACASGADCIGFAFDLIRTGRIDSAIAGASEYPILPLGIAVFDRAGACSRDQIRPFDKNRTGMVFGEGCGVLVIEELETARLRGATIYAELVGYGSTSDAIHITAPDPEGNGAAAAMRIAMDVAKINPMNIDYISAHGTGTGLNDLMETRAVKHALGEHAYNVPMSSTKSMTGHAMGATAAMEAVFSVLAIRDNVAPPTINYETPDPECDLDYVPNSAREKQIDCVMSNAFGFGGHNASLIFKRFSD